MSEPDFIGLYDNALTQADCTALIDRFEKSERKTRGAMGSGVDIALKDSWDITISNFPEWKDAEAALNNAMLKGLILYLRAYPFAALAPYQTRAVDTNTGNAVIIQPQMVAQMSDKDVAAIASKFFRPGSINIQKYIAGSGGYPHWHSEVYPLPGSTESLHRVLLWTIYLNEGFEAGETEFVHQRAKVVPKTGTILLAPSGFTHTHRGNRPVGKDKYIATSWVLMQKAEALYPTAK